MMSRRTCQELGVCQGRPGCACSAPAVRRVDTSTLPPGEFYFAPGTLIETRPRRGWRLSSQVVEAVSRATLAVAACGALAAAIGFSVGWLTAKGWLL